MQPETTTSNVKSWDAFQARKAARATDPAAAAESLTQKLAESITVARAARKPRKPVEAKEATLADVLRQAVTLAVGRRERVTREVAVREATLLEVLTDAMRAQ